MISDFLSKYLKTTVVYSYTRPDIPVIGLEPSKKWHSFQTESTLYNYEPVHKYCTSCQC